MNISEMSASSVFHAEEMCRPTVYSLNIAVERTWDGNIKFCI